MVAAGVVPGAEGAEAPSLEMMLAEALEANRQLSELAGGLAEENARLRARDAERDAEFAKAGRRVTCYYFYLWDEDSGPCADRQVMPRRVVLSWSEAVLRARRGHCGRVGVWSERVEEGQ